MATASTRRGDRRVAADDAQPVVVFDGGCGLCHATVRWLMRLDRRGRLRFCARASPEGRALLERVAPRLLEQDTLVLVERARAYARSDAAIRIARWLGVPEPLLRVASLVPRPVRDVVYDFVAANRHKWPVSASVCPVEHGVR